MKNAIIIKLLAFTLLAIIINACKKTDPDCDTCPCPACPRITEILPNHGRSGDTLILNGINFNEDPYLNIVTINDTLVQEILEGTTTQLKVVVPEGASTGPVRIKINDDKALSSDEIPDFNEPIFTYDHYVELVAGRPGVQGTLSAEPLNATFFDPYKIAINKINDSIYLTEQFNKRIRLITKDSATTFYKDASGSQWDDVTQDFSGKVYFTDYNSSQTTGYRVRFIENGLAYTSVLSIPLSDKNLTGDICIDEISGNMYFVWLKLNQPNKGFYFAKKNLNNGVVDTLVYFDPNYPGTILGAIKDIELHNNDIYFILSWSIIKLDSKNSYQPDTIYSSPLGTLLGGLAVSKNGDVYFSKFHEIFKLSNGNEVSIAGSSVSGYNTTETVGSQSLFKSIQDIDFDINNNLYIVDAGNYCIRRLKID